MKMMKIVLTILLFAGVVTPAVGKSSEFKYANDEEVNLILGQADRATAQYERVIAQEKTLLGDSVDTATDTTLVTAWKTVKAALSKDPQKFNSFAGFDMVTLLDDASRNNALSRVVSEVFALAGRPV